MSSPQDVVELARRARQTLGPEPTLMVDVGYLFNDVPTVARICRELEELDIFFFETPFPVDSPEPYARLAELTSIPLAMGEHGVTRWEFLDMMDRGTNSAQLWEGLAQRSTAPYMVTAPAQAEMTFKNNLYKQAVEQMKLNVAAAPDPGAAGLYNMVSAIGASAASIGLGAMGGKAATAPSSNPGAAAGATNAANAGTAAGAGAAYNWGWGG